MATSSYQDRSFIDSVVSNTLLEESIEWIASNLSPGDVFDASEVESWVIDYVKSNLSPEEVFDKSDLDSWAEANGYAEEDE